VQIWQARPVSLPRCYGRRMIDLGSIAGLHSRNHQLHAYCPTCDRWAVLPLAEMVTASSGDRRLPIRARCGGYSEASGPQGCRALSAGRAVRPTSGSSFGSHVSTSGHRSHRVPTWWL
jgi:hypothetical protein